MDDAEPAPPTTAGSGLGVTGDPSVLPGVVGDGAGKSTLQIITWLEVASGCQAPSEKKWGANLPSLLDSPSWAPTLPLLPEKSTHSVHQENV